MKLPVCIWDLESDFLCPSCQERYDSGEITDFDIEFSKWMLEKEKEYPALGDLNLRRAIKASGRLILIVKKRQSRIIEGNEGFLEELTETFGDTMIFEAPTKIRKVVRKLIEPAVEVGVNSLYLPDGSKESIVMLRPGDRERIKYSKQELREIVSAVIGESVLFQYQDERIEKKEETEIEELEEKLQGFTERRMRR